MGLAWSLVLRSQMGVIPGQVAVIMCSLVWIVGWPQPDRQDHARRCQQGESSERPIQARARANQTRQRVGDQPAAMAQRELRCKDSRSILGVC